jgi:hypothetical protein
VEAAAKAAGVVAVAVAEEAAATDGVAVAAAVTDGVAVAAAVTAGAGAVGIIRLTFPVMFRRTFRIGVAATITRM